MKLSVLLYYIFNAYLLLIIVRLFMSWIPTIDWNTPFCKFIKEAADVYLTPFRKIIPPLGGLDFSPILAILLLQFCAQHICIALMRSGL